MISKTSHYEADNPQLFTGIRVKYGLKMVGGGWGWGRGVVGLEVLIYLVIFFWDI